MSKNRIPKHVALLVSISMLYGLPGAQADLGQTNLQMTATLVANTCSVSTDSTGQYVDLGHWATNWFTEGKRTWPVEFAINIENCNGISAGVAVTFTGTTDAADSQLLALSADSTATHVGVSILDKDKNAVTPGISSTIYPINKTSSRASLVFYGQYVATSDIVTAGKANADTTFTLTYE